MKGKKLQQVLLPLLVVIPYMAYVMNDRMNAHHERRKEIDEAKELAKSQK